KYLIDAAQASGQAKSAWLSQAVSNWRVWAVITELGFTIDEHWSSEQRDTFIALAEQVCAALATRDSIAAEEIVNWHFADDLHLETRGAKNVPTKPVIELGRAIISLVRGELPEAPKGEAWFFGTEAGRSTIRMDPSWNGRW